MYISTIRDPQGIVLLKFNGNDRIHVRSTKHCTPYKSWIKAYRPKRTSAHTSTIVNFLPGYKNNSTNSSIDRNISLRDHAVVMFTASAILGPLLDNQHSQFNVLAYADPFRFSLVPGLVDIETTWWTPLLFGVAGVIIGVGLYSLDSYFLVENKNENRSGDKSKSWNWVLLGIAVFVLQYWLSAVLESPLLGINLPGTSLPAEDVILAATALLSFFIFDITPQGFFMSALTAISGPIIEIILIKQGLYHYAHPVVFEAVPTWIAWTYFAGGPAVGNLGRKTAQILRDSSN